MFNPLAKLRRHVIAITPERSLVVGAMAIIGLGFAQPTVMTLVGMEFGQEKFAAMSLDYTPLGAVQPQEPPRPRSNPTMAHGLTGVIKPIRR